MYLRQNETRQNIGILLAWHRVLAKVLRKITISGIDIDLRYSDVAIPAIDPNCMTSDQMTGRTVLDVGSGSGILALSALLRGARKVHGIDLNPNSILAANLNLVVNDLPKNSALFYISDLFANVIGEFDFIVCNPPFRSLPASNVEAAKFSSDYFMSRFFPDCLKHLSPDGKLIFGASSTNPQMLLQLQSLAEKYGLRMIVRECRKSAMLRVLRFFLYGSVMEKNLCCELFRIDSH